MSNITPFDNNDWFRRFFDRSNNMLRRTGFFDLDPFREFEAMREEMERRIFGQHQYEDIQKKAPKELIREYQTPEGAKVREVGSIVWIFNDNRS